MRHHVLHLLALAVGSGWLTTPASAQETPPPIPLELRQRFGFLGPKIHKLANGISWPLPARGTPPGLLVANPLRGRLELLQLKRTNAGAARDDMTGWQVIEEAVPTDGELRGLAMGDLDGDGHDDIVMVDSSGRVKITLRNQTGKNADRPLPTLEIGRPKGDCLRLADVDGDGRADALILDDDGLRVITGITTQPVVHPAQPVFAARVQDFLVFDFDGDGHKDVVLCTTESRSPLHFKRGLGGAAFGPWVLLQAPKLVSAFVGSGAGGKASVATIAQKPRRVVEYELRAATGIDRPAIELSAFPPNTSSQAHLHADIDGDGDLDLVVADPKRASLTFMFEHDGGFSHKVVPSLSGIASLACGDLDADGKPDIVMASPSEGAVAVCYGKNGLDVFPTRLVTKDHPTTVAVQGREVLFLARDDSRKGSLYRIPAAAADQPAEAGPTRLAQLERFNQDPSQLWIADLDGQPGEELAFVLSGTGLIVLFPTAKGEYEKHDIGAGFAKGIAEGAVSVTETGQGRALRVVRERFARIFRLNAQHQPVVLSQDNGPEGMTAMDLAAAMPDGSRIYLDRKNNSLFRVRAGQPTVSIDVPAISPLFLLPHEKSVLVLGQRGVMRIPFDRSHRLQAVRTHEPPTRKTNYWRGMAADFDGDGKAELAVLDTDVRGLQLLAASADKLERALAIPVFEANGDEDQFEPRAMAAGDLDGDGRQDLMLISHDRILIYLQEH